MFEKRNNFTQQEKIITVIKIIEPLEVNSYYDGTTPNEMKLKLQIITEVKRGRWWENEKQKDNVYLYIIN